MAEAEQSWVRRQIEPALIYLGLVDGPGPQRRGWKTWVSYGAVGASANIISGHWGWWRVMAGEGALLVLVLLAAPMITWCRRRRRRRAKSPEPITDAGP